MKRAISIILTIAILLIPGVAFSNDTPDEIAVKQLLKNYFDLKYKMLSTLTYNSEIKNFIFPEILSSRESLDESIIVETIIKYRKAQINDLRFDRYKYDLIFNSVKVQDGQAWVNFSENFELYFKCAPTVKNSSQVEHYMLLKNRDGKWFVANDEYTDPDGIKKKIIKYFIKDNLTIETSIENVLKDFENQTNSRLEKLNGLVAGQKDKNIIIFHAGKSIAYINGTAKKIDNEKNITPVLSSNNVMLPAIKVFEQIGWHAGWQDKDTLKVVADNGNQAKIKINSTSMFVSSGKSEYEKRVSIKTPAKLMDGTVMLSSEAFAQIIGKKLFYDGKGLVIITDSTLDKTKNTKLIETLQEFYSVFFTKTDFPKVDGSTATYPFSIEMGKELLGLDDTGAKGFITHNTTHNAYVNLINKTADIIFVTEPSQDEYKLAKQKGVQLEVIPICKEGFVFLANKKNTINNLTSKQIRDIYQGKIKNWRDVGGENISIIPYQREANSGSQTIMENNVMKGLNLMQPPKETIVFGMGELIDRVADYSNAKNALGYSVFYYATTMYTNRNVKLLSIDGVAPSKQTIKNGTYPFTISYYAVIRKSEPADSNTRKLLKWILGKEGQSIVDKAGFVPVI